jgi:hypothetical protein
MPTEDKAFLEFTE